MRPAGLVWTDAQVRLVVEAAVTGTVRGLRSEDEPLPLAQLAPRPALAAPVQIWDGDIEIVDGAGDPVGTVHAWGYSTPADHVFEILEMTDPSAYFSESTLRYRNLDTTNDPPWTIHQAVEAAYDSGGSSRWGMAVTEHLTGITNATIESKLVSPSLTGMTATWYRVEVGSGSTWDKAGMLYRVAEDASPPSRCLDQWFFSSGYLEPNSTGTREVRITKVVGGTSISALHAEISYTGAWTYQRFAWHFRPMS